MGTLLSLEFTKIRMAQTEFKTIYQVIGFKPPPTWVIAPLPSIGYPRPAILCFEVFEHMNFQKLLLLKQIKVR